MGRKDHIRDYATEAFRFYKSSGGAELYKDKIWNDALIRSQKSDIKNDSISKPTEAAVMRAQRAVDEAVSAIEDLEAVERTLDIIRGMKSGSAILEAVDTVYFTEPDKDIEKGDIQARVHKAEINIPASERTIYYWLKRARKMFAVERGLRL